jgi:malate dehydrogenase (oxaloacetate-decarboxylating)(NADP+)
MLELGDVEGMISTMFFHVHEGLRPPLQVVKTAPGCKVAAGVYMIALRNKVLFFADAIVNIEPDAEELAEIAILTAQLARDFDIEPRVAMLGFSNFGGTRHPHADTVRKAAEIVRQREPDLPVDGEMQVEVALSEELQRHDFPFNKLGGEANVLIFPNLEAGNIGYKLVKKLANAEVVGPIMVGMNKPVYMLQRGDEAKDVVNLAAIAVVEAQKLDRRGKLEDYEARYEDLLPCEAS